MTSPGALDHAVRHPLGGDRLVDRMLAGGASDSPALLADSAALDFGDLGCRVESRGRELALAHRSVVVLSGARSIEWVVTYLALLAEGHVPLLADERHAERFGADWAADAVVAAGADAITIRRADRRPRELHPELALLLSTSGSTGSPKLVRLSQQNLTSNAEAIVSYLGLGPTDRAISSLPLHYCYGLSVLHSHLVAGGSVTMTDLSVVDPCFAALAHRVGITNLAGVPHTFEMIERSGADRLRVPELRFLTQAGGRWPAADAARWMDRAERWGVDLFLMYGQTEAAARMAYAPPALARRHPGVLGHAIPGGTLRIDPDPAFTDGTGELVYQGPNVMMGYAVGQADLAEGAVLDELHTGDLARPALDGTTFEIVGRRSRFAKVLGLRIDLDQLERDLARSVGEVAVAGHDDGLVILAAAGDAGALRASAAEQAGLPSSSVEGLIAEIPRTTSGKVDHAEVLRLGAAQRAAWAAPTTEDRTGRVAAIYQELLGVAEPHGGTTFVAAGGDSLSYVECSVRLERAIGPLPPDWHLLTIDELESATTRRSSGVDTTIVLRAVGICTVVATHMRLAWLPGGAHLLLAVAGYNFSRFHLTIGTIAARLRAARRTIARTAIPTVAWVAGSMALFGGFGLTTLALVNSYLGETDRTDGRWQYWFIEAYVQIYVAATALTVLSAFRRVDRRHPFGTPLAVLVATLAMAAFPWTGVDALPQLRGRAHMVAWLFVLGWLLQRARTPGQKVVATLACLVTIPGFFDNPAREGYVIGGLVLLTWFRSVPFPRVAIRPLAAVSAASLWILISHFRLYPALMELLPLPVAYVATVASGVAVWWAASRLGRWAGWPDVRARCAAARTRWSPRGPATTPG